MLTAGVVGQVEGNCGEGVGHLLVRHTPVTRSLCPACRKRQLIFVMLSCQAAHRNSSSESDARTEAGALLGFFHGARLTKPKGKSAEVWFIEP